MNFTYGVTLEHEYWLLGNLILPIAALSFVMAVVFKPKRTDAGYKMFLFLHFFSGPILCEVGLIVGDLKLGNLSLVLFSLIGITIHCFAFWLGLKLRESAAMLPPQELSDFLCQTILEKGAAAMGTMLFFSFETVSCFISQKSLDNGQCTNTSNVATRLSIYITIITTLSIVSKSVPKSVQMETTWELSAIASLKGLKWWQRVQGTLMVITAISSLYLLSALGVEGDRNDMLFFVGSMGSVSLGVTFLISATMLVRIKAEHQRGGNSEMLDSPRSDRGISSSELEDGMLMGALL